MHGCRRSLRLRFLPRPGGLLICRLSPPTERIPRRPRSAGGLLACRLGLGIVPRRRSKIPGNPAHEPSALTDVSFAAIFHRLGRRVSWQFPVKTPEPAGCKHPVTSFFRSCRMDIPVRRAANDGQECPSYSPDSIQEFVAGCLFKQSPANCHGSRFFSGQKPPVRASRKPPSSAGMARTRVLRYDVRCTTHPAIPIDFRVPPTRFSDGRQFL